MTYKYLLALALAASTAARADNADLDQMLELNALAAAHARLCNEEPVAEQLKATTMMVLALSGVPAQNVQLGSGKFADTMRQEVYAHRKAKDLQCASRVQAALARLDDVRQRSAQLRQPR
ncbi:MAG: hypothetical protein FJY37_03420 [Betaproteobacteria bacterium]|nr:hypothetical protein [Betaproteobacteria bacterium]